MSQFRGISLSVSSISGRPPFEVYGPAPTSIPIGGAGPITVGDNLTGAYIITGGMLA